MFVLFYFEVVFVATREAQECVLLYIICCSVLDAVGNPRPESSTQRRRKAQKYVSRCHVADICRVIEASIADPRNG